MKLNDMSIEDLKRSLEEVALDLAAQIVKASAILSEMKNRKVYHPFMRTAILRHYDAITSGKLSPSAVIALGGSGPLISAIKSLPIDQQDALAQGGGVDVAEMKNTGEIAVTMRPIVQLSQATLERVFSPDGIRSLAEQKAMLRRGSDRRKVEGVIVDYERRELIFGRKRVKPMEVAAALKELGYQVTKAEKPQSTHSR